MDTSEILEFELLISNELTLKLFCLFWELERFYMLLLEACLWTSSKLVLGVKIFSYYLLGVRGLVSISIEGFVLISFFLSSFNDSATLRRLKLLELNCRFWSSSFSLTFRKLFGSVIEFKLMEDLWFLMRLNFAARPCELWLANSTSSTPRYA